MIRFLTSDLNKENVVTWNPQNTCQRFRLQLSIGHVIWQKNWKKKWKSSFLCLPLYFFAFGHEIAVISTFSNSVALFFLPYSLVLLDDNGTRIESSTYFSWENLRQNKLLVHHVLILGRFLLNLRKSMSTLWLLGKIYGKNSLSNVIS